MPGAPAHPIAAAVLAALGAFVAAGALAQSVPIGRYTEVAAGKSSHPYPMSGVDGHRSGRSTARAPISRVTLAWGHQLHDRRLTPPVVLADGTVALGSGGGVYAFGADGSERWFAAVGAVQFTPSVTPNGDLLVTTADGKLVLVDGAGRFREVAENLPFAGAPLLLPEGAVVVGGRERQVLILDLDGTQVASVPIPERAGLWSALVGSGLVVVAGRSQILTLLSVHGGYERDIRLAQRVGAGPAVASDGTIWVLGEQGTLWGMAPSGRVRATAELGGVGEAPVIGRDGAVRIGVPGGDIVCIGPSGDERWRRGVDARPGPLLLDSDDAVLFVTARGTLYVIDHDGELRFRQSIGVRGAGRPVLAADGAIYVVSQSGLVQAFR